MRIKLYFHLDDGRTIETIALIDSGAGGIFIDVNFAKLNKIPLSKRYKPIPVYNVDSMPNKNGEITEETELKMQIEGRTRRHPFLATALGEQTVILGHQWLEEENPDIDWRKHTIRWRDEPKRIYATIQQEEEYYTTTESLVISFLKDELTEEAENDWLKTRMSHSQAFA